MMEIAGKKLRDPAHPGPAGVRGRSSDNRLIREQLGWAPPEPLRDGPERRTRGSPSRSRLAWP